MQTQSPGHVGQHSPAAPWKIFLSPKYCPCIFFEVPNTVYTSFLKPQVLSTYLFWSPKYHLHIFFEVPNTVCTSFLKLKILPYISFLKSKILSLHLFLKSQILPIFFFWGGESQILPTHLFEVPNTAYTSFWSPKYCLYIFFWHLKYCLYIFFEVPNTANTSFGVSNIVYTPFLKSQILSMHLFWRLHLHLSLNHGGQWGTTDDFTTGFLHFSVFHYPLGLDELQACPFPDVVFQPHFLSALSCSPNHHALQDGFGQTWWTGDKSMPLQFVSLYDDQEVFTWSDCLLDLGTEFLIGNVVFVWDA